MTLHACPRNGKQNRTISKTFITLAGLLIVSASFAQTVPDISRWNGGTAIAPSNGHTLGNALTLTWGFLRDGTNTINSTNGNSSGIASNLITRFDTTFGSGPGGSDLTQRPWFTYFNESYNRWGQVSGLSFQYEANDDGANQTGGNGGVLGVRADMRVGGRNLDGASGVLAYNYFPNVGDMVIDTGDMANFGNNTDGFRFLRNTLTHEIGHGIGCEHCESNNRGILMEPFLSTGFDGPQLHDIMLAHRGYGDKNEKTNSGAGNDTATNATSLGVLNSGGSFAIGEDARTTNGVVSRTATDFVSIDDQTDTDFYSLALAQDGTLNLTVEVLGDIYNITSQGGPAQASFNTFQRQDLTLSLFDAAGLTLIAQSNLTGLGGNESLSRFLTAGTYAIRITGVDNIDAVAVDTQFYSLSGSFEAVPEPATMAVLGLAAATVIRRKRKA